ncbi:MAG: response regulator transcription factor [Desulfobulbaceae bacterium]|nr:response regulator transcription factor [Desulfobulbaceae bacterium]
MNDHILVIEDEEDILELITYNLNKEGCRVHGVLSGEEGLAYARKHRPDLILLDLMLPGIDGFAVCRQLKADPSTCRIPLLMVTARGEEADIVTGLEMGADDYLTKPFSPKVLFARIRTVLRRPARAETPEEGVLTRDELVIDQGRHQVRIGENPIQLTSTEFRILHFLAARPGWVFTRDQIVNAIHETNFAVTTRAIDVQIVGLRKKLGSKENYIETVRGVGYRFKE